MTQRLNELIYDEALYRTAPATPGLLNNIIKKKKKLGKVTPFHVIIQ